MRHLALLSLLFASHLLFLWMFLASGGFERMAQKLPDALSFSADWRHGMTSGCPIYMPGYFLLSVTTWIWSGARRLRILLLEGAIILSLAWGTAELLAPLGTSMLVETFGRRTGITFLLIFAAGGLLVWISLRNRTTSQRAAEP